MRSLSLGIITLVFSLPGFADVVPLTFVKLTGITGGTVAGTAVYRASLSGLPLSQILSITITDNSSGLGGATGQFSGFDLDAIKLSTTLCGDAACATTAAGLGVFDFAGGVAFTPGAQRAPADPKLFGTGPGGNTVDDAVATLGSFDGESIAAVPGAFGFLSMGDNGVLAFDLTSAVSPTDLYLYIGEVGDNGEVAAGQITVSDTRTVVPEPGSVFLLGTISLAVLGGLRRRLS